MAAKPRAAKEFGPLLGWWDLTDVAVVRTHKVVDETFSDGGGAKKNHYYYHRAKPSDFFDTQLNANLSGSNNCIFASPKRPLFLITPSVFVHVRHRELFGSFCGVSQEPFACFCINLPP